jgi:cytochrome b
MTDAYAPSERGPRWDPLVRLTHWTIAAAVLLNGLITEDGEFLHTAIGYTAFTVLALRLLWGFIGPEEARFTAFPPSPKAALHHVSEIVAGDKVKHRSHNPLGALMAYALWATLSVVVATGMIMDQGRFGDRGTSEQTGSISAPKSAPNFTLALIKPALADDDDRHERHEHEDEEEDGIVSEIHEIAANLLLVLAALHVIGVAVESRRRQENLVRSMVTGGTREDASP